MPDPLKRSPRIIDPPPGGPPPVVPPVIPVPPTNPSLIPVNFVPGGLLFKDAAPMLATVVDNGICPDDPRVMVRTNEATKIILDSMIPVGGMATYNVTAIDTILYLPPQLENAIEAFPVDPSTKVRGSTDITEGWYEIVNDSAYLDPNQHHDNPMIDRGLWPDVNDPSVLRRVYEYQGLQPVNSVIQVTGAKRFIPLKTADDFLIVQNIEALKCIIISIERYENSAPDEAQKYRQSGLELLQAEVKKHILDPRNYMRRKSEYQNDTVNFPENTLGWVRGNIALDVDEALKTGKIDLTWSINQIERRIMQHGVYKDCVVFVTATVTGGIIYFPFNIQSVMAVDLNGTPIPVRSQFFQHLDNGPGMFPCNEMLIDQGDQYFPGTRVMHRKYKLIADCTNGQPISAVCKLRWISKQPDDLMVIKNYEAIRMMMTAKFQEEKKDFQSAQVNQTQAFAILDKELQDYLAGIKHTVHVQTFGFGLGDVGNYWVR
jgi:hypothetical protein